MARNWTRYITSSPTDAGRALVLQGTRLNEAKRHLSDERYSHIIDRAGITPREATVLAFIGHRLGHLLNDHPNLRFPYKIRTLNALSDLSSERINQAAREGLIRPSMTETECKALRGPERPAIPTVIRPTDNWNFGSLRWPRIDGFDSYGYIPGDIYANCIWFYAQDGDTILDPMAGSGMIFRVWEDRESWLGKERNGITIQASDLFPRGPYAHQISQLDLTSNPLQSQPDYIIIDPPYPQIVSGQYSRSSNDLANMAPPEWISAISAIANKFHGIQPKGGRSTVIVPNNRDINTGERILYPDAVRHEFKTAGYQLYDTVYASRRTQQKQGRRMAILNNKARQTRVPMTDVSEILTFIKS